MRLALCAVAAALWTAFIFSNSLKPAYASSKDSQWLLRLARNVLPHLSEHSLRKAAHFGEFAVLLHQLVIGSRFDDETDEPRPR